MAGLKMSQHLKIELKEILVATENFKTCIGNGGFGTVYKGELTLNGRRTIVAVKRLSEQYGQGLKEFLTEIDLLTGQDHPNLISLFGYCDEGKEKILVYEYAAWGSLDRYIRRNDSRYPLTWVKRLKICADAARGLDHLHRHVGKHQVVIHRDVKSSNILLDVNWVAKVSDLGFSKLSFKDRSGVISMARGTLGYCEPEYISSGIVKKESDIYSFGVVLFEVLTGRLCFVKEKDGFMLSAKLAMDYYEKKKLEEIIDPRIRENMSPISLEKFSKVAYECLHNDREQRPQMDVVTKELEETLQIQVTFEISKMSVIGFDIGNKSCVIASAKSGGIDVLLNDGLKRETPTVVSFGDKHRCMGSAWAAFATGNPKSTISHIKRLIGKLYIEVEEDLKLLPFTTSEGPRGGILIELEYLKKKWTFTPVEILGMLFKHLKQVTEKSLQSIVDDCVIGIPSYFSDLQRRMYLDAAHIAGLNPLRLMHDGTAIALGYGMYKTDLSNSQPTNVMFVDIGHCDTQVTVAAFEQRKLTILSHSFDQNLGGRDFDEVLFKYFAAQFNRKHKIDVYSNVRASVRLMASCEKVKKVLSANAEAPLSIECLIGDIDVRGIITRVKFENLSSKLLDKVTVCCKRALMDSGLTVNKLYTIELVGSGSRIPAITRVLTSFFAKEPTRTLNASECVARGCALRCAMLSPNLQVLDYEVEDSLPYSVVIPLAREEIMVFPKGTSFPNEKILHHSIKIPFYLQVAYGKSKVFPAGISHIIGHFGIGSSERSDAEEVKAEFKLKLSHHGIVKLDSAKILEDKHHSGGILKINPWKMLAPDNYTRNLPVYENLDVSITNDELVEAKEKERILTEQDTKVEEIKDQRNTLESFVYDTRSKLSGAYKSFATDSDKEVITSKLQETEDWLYDDIDDDSEQDYTGRLGQLKKLLEPIENKYNEERDLTKARKALQSSIEKRRSNADSLQADKKEKVKRECIEVEQWINTFSQKESSPKIVSTEIYRAIEIFENKCKSIIRSKPSLPRHEESVDHENAMAKALEACFAKHRSQAESLPASMKDKVDELLKQRDSIQSSFTVGRSVVVGSGSNTQPSSNGGIHTKVPGGSGDGENNNSPNEEGTSDSKSKKKWFNINLKGDKKAT